MKKLVLLLSVLSLLVILAPSVVASTEYFKQTVETHFHTDWDVGYVSRPKGRKMAKRISVQRAKIDKLNRRVRELEDFTDFAAYIIFTQHADDFSF